MDQLITSDIELTSLDIADLTGKMHKHVMADIRKETADLGEEIGRTIFRPIERMDSYNRKQPCYTFGKDGAMQLALKYDAKTRYKVIKRIEELESGNKPMSPSELALLQAQNMVTLEKEVKEQRAMIQGVANEQKNMAEIIGMTSVQWRKKVTSILNRIANNQGGFEMYRTIRNESYEKLEERGRCKLNIRVLNKQKVMALNGVAKSKVDKVSKLDVIADDARLTEIYLAIVKELAIKYRVNISDVELNETAGG